ncbi:MAG: AI-2E family transporter [Oscillospiraceae bacterium]|nr:AI-2E family transporter [Ruminococcus sp.]
MKIKFNTKSNTVAVYCILVFAACLFLVALVFKYNTFLYYIHKIIKVLSPIIWGIVFAYILNPFVILCDKHLKKLFRRTKKCRSISRTVSIGISLILMLGIIIAIVCSIVPEILNTLEDFIQSLPAYFNNLQNFLTNKISSILEKNPKINDFLNSEFNNIQHVILDYVKKFEPMLDSLIAKDGIIANVTGSAWSFIIGLKDCLLGLIVSIYLLYNKETFIAQAKKIVYAILPERPRNTVLKIASQTNHTFSHFLTGKALDSFIIGILTFIGLQFMGLKNYAVLLSVVIGITNMIPFFGPIIGAVPCGLLILLTTPEKTIIFIIFILLLQQFDGNILGPKIIGNSLGLSSFWIIFAIFVGGGLFGPIGMIVFIPIFAVFYNIIREWVNTKLERKKLPVSTAYYKCEDEQKSSKKSPSRFIKLYKKSKKILLNNKKSKTESNNEKQSSDPEDFNKQ